MKIHYQKKIFIILFMISSFQFTNAQCNNFDKKNITSPSLHSISFKNYGKIPKWWNFSAWKKWRKTPDSYGLSRIYYPTDVASKKLKPIILCPGFVGVLSFMSEWAKFLAQRGYIVIVIQPKNITTEPESRAIAIVDAINHITKEKNKNSPIYNRIDISSGFAVLGHSMGGGGAQLANEKEERIKTVIALSPWLNPMKNVIFKKNTPKLIVVGQWDGIAPIKIHSKRHFENTPVTASKMIYVIKNKIHNSVLLKGVIDVDAGNIVYAFLKTYFDREASYCKYVVNKSLINQKSASEYNTKFINCDSNRTIDK